MPLLTDGQRLAIAQLHEVAEVAPGALEVVAIHEPVLVGDCLKVHISINCAGMEHSPRGVRVRGREQFIITICGGFPFEPPLVDTITARWPGTPHVQWRRRLCLYVAPTTEWQPHDGIYGLLDRLWEWLKCAAKGELDPVGGPMHPPVAYSGSGPLVVMRADTPAVGNEPWIGWARVERHGNHRVDVVEWSDDLVKWPEGAAVAIFLTAPMDFEYPSMIGGLIDDLEQRKVSKKLLLAALRCGAFMTPEDEELLTVIGAPMRGIVGGDAQQHLAAWAIEWDRVRSIKNSAPRKDDSDELAKLRAELEESLMKVLELTSADWRTVIEDRPEIVQRRDDGSTLEWFRDRAVAVWGCGAIGAHIAEWLVRAGVKRIVLRDKAIVKPGILARQPFKDRDIGLYKVRVLAERLKAINPALEVEAHTQDILRAPLSGTDWDDDCEVVIDATASSAVGAKLEVARRKSDTKASVAALIVGHTAAHGAAVLCSPDYSGGTADAFRQVHLRCANSPALAVFNDEFWPNPARTDYFQPEPGCSDPTFTGAAPDVVSISALLLREIARDLESPITGSRAHLVALSDHESGCEHHRFTIPPASTFADGVGTYEIRLSQSALAEINAWISKSRRENGEAVETGGHLFGSRDDSTGTIWIDEVTGPPSDSVHSAKEFVCGTQDVPEIISEKRERSGDELRLVGMWHTHPGGPAFPSERDLISMLGLVNLEEHALPYSCMLIAGQQVGQQVLGAYVFSRKDLPKPFSTIYVTDRSSSPITAAPALRNVGLALSGGGARAIAFHLGCLRALHDRGVLERVQVVSSVSGGSIVGAMWAYGDEPFEEFESRVVELLRRGLRGEILRELAGPLGAKAAWSSASFRAARAARFVVPSAANRVRGTTRTDALQAALVRCLFGDLNIAAKRRDDIATVVNACDLRTGSAARFGSEESGVWRFGKIVNNEVPLAAAVAASAAYPLLLPAMEREFLFEKQGKTTRERVILTDGGVYDNLATSCLEPGRDAAFSSNVFDVQYIVSCDAGRGLMEDAFPSRFRSRLARSFNATHRKAQDAARSKLYEFDKHSELLGFALAYLGVQDSALHFLPNDLVRRHEVVDYPTDFSPMQSADIDRLSRRGEQLTRMSVDRWCSGL